MTVPRRVAPVPRPGPAPRLLRGRLLRGRNVHHWTTVFSQPLDPGLLSVTFPADVGADFVDGFLARFGTLASLSPDGSLSEAARAALRGTPGLSLTQALLEAILAIERCVAYTMGRLDEPGFARIVQRDETVDLVWETHSSGIARAAARAALAGLLDLLPDHLRPDVDPGRDFATRVAKLLRRSRRRQWSATAAVLALAAKQRGFSHEMLAGSYLRLGAGVMQQVVSESTLGVSRRSAVGVAAARADGRLADGEQVYRLLVVGGTLVSALRCDPPVIVGDGIGSIRQRIERLNEDPRRDGLALRAVVLDEQLTAGLAELDLDPDRVLAKGEELSLPGVRTFARGAIPVDVTEHVHASVREAVAEAMAGQDRPIVSLEFVTADIGRSCRTGRGRVTGANRSTELYLHAVPVHGQTQRVGEAALDLIFPAGVETRIPTALVVGERGTRSIASGLDRLLRNSRDGVGLALRGQTTIQGRPVDPTSLGRRGGPEFLLGDPRVSVVVSATSPRKIVERGLQLDRFSVTALADPDPKGDLETYRAGVEVSLAATDALVIAAEHPYAETILQRLDTGRVLLVTTQRQHPMAVRHTAAGGSTVVAARGRTDLELRRGGETIASIPVAALRASDARPSGASLRRALHAAGLAFALGVTAATRGPGLPPQPLSIKTHNPNGDPRR